MSDERISETTGSPRCPECHGRDAWTPFGPCPRCGRLPEVRHQTRSLPIRIETPIPDAPRWVVWVARGYFAAMLTFGLSLRMLGMPEIFTIVPLVAGPVPWMIISIRQAILNRPPPHPDPEN